MKKVCNAIGMGIVLALILLFLKNQYARKLPTGNYGIQAAVEMGHIDNLFIGSSMFRQGLEISVIERELPGTSYILSYNGNQPAFIAMELEYLLNQGVQIENLYIDLYPYSAAANPWISDTKMLLDTDIQFKLDTWRLMRENNETDFLDFYELFVTANNEQLLTYPIHYRLLESQFHNGGSTLKPEGRTKEYLEGLESLGARERIHPEQVKGYEKLMILAEERGLNMIFLETPKYEKMLRDKEYQKLLKSCVEFLNHYQEKYVLAEELSFDTSDAANYQDLIHLSYRGRTIYTESVCAYLKEHAAEKEE